MVRTTTHWRALPRPWPRVDDRQKARDSERTRKSGAIVAVLVIVRGAGDTAATRPKVAPVTEPPITPWLSVHPPTRRRSLIPPERRVKPVAFSAFLQVAQHRAGLAKVKKAKSLEEPRLAREDLTSGACTGAANASIGVTLRRISVRSVPLPAYPSRNVTHRGEM
jgi:hypothetical protein